MASGPTLTSNVVKLGRKTLMQGYKEYDSSYAPDFASKMAVNTLTTQQAWEEMASFAGPGLPSVVDEYGKTPVAQYRQINTATYKPVKVRLGVEFSYEAFKDEQAAYNILHSYGQDLRAGHNQFEDIAATNRFFNMADQTGDYACPDGVAIGSASHPIEGGTYSNVATAAAISPESFNAMLLILRRQPAYTEGMLMPYNGSVVIECAPEQHMAALELQKSTLRPDTANNTANVLSGQISEIVVNPYITNPLWWCVRGTNNRRLRRFKLEREAFSITSFEFDDELDRYIARTRSRRLYGIMDWRDQVFNYAS